MLFFNQRIIAGCDIALIDLRRNKVDFCKLKNIFADNIEDKDNIDEEDNNSENDNDINKENNEDKKN